MTRASRMRRVAHGCGAPAVLGATIIAGLLSCTDGSQPSAPPPLVVHAAIAPGPHNVLSAVVTVTFLNTDSAAVRFGPVGEGLDSVTPATPLSSDSAALPVLGLLPETSYRLQVVAYGEGPLSTGDTLSFTTGSLPTDLPVYSAGGSDPSPGYVVFAADPYGLVIDNTGRIVWYRYLGQGPTLNFQVQPTGRYTTSPIAPVVGDPTPWVEFDPLGDETRRLGCADGLKSRFHDLLEEPDGSYWLMCDDTRVMDLTPYGGQPVALVTGTVVQHVDGHGNRLFTWTPFDHFAITDLDSASRTGATVNWTHGNAIDFDTDGNLIVSFRSLSEITKIDLATGAVLWRLGGRANQFTITGTSAPFVGQHGLRVVSSSQLELLDNRGQPGGSQAELYVLDEAGRTANLSASYSSGPPVTAILGGSTQSLSGGRVLVAYGDGDRVQEYDALGNVVWEIHNNPGYVFRAQRIASLYLPGVGMSR